MLALFISIKIEPILIYTPVQTTTNHLYACRCILAVFACHPHSVTQEKKPSLAQTQDLHRLHRYNPRCHKNEIPGIHFQLVISKKKPVLSLTYYNLSLGVSKE